MIYTLTLNPSVDLIISLENFVKNRVNLSESEYKLPGGKGINVSQVLKNLGINTKTYGFIGGFTGKFIDEKLKEKGIDTDFIEVEEDTRINIKIKELNYESELNGNSPYISLSKINELLKKLFDLKESDVLVMAGSVPKNITGIYSKIMEKVKAKIILDTKGQPLKEALVYKPYMIKPNTFELEEIFNVEITKENVVYYAKKLVEMGAENVIVSMAGDGAILVNSKQVLKGNVPRGKVVNSVGAGDSLVAGFTYGLLNNFSVKESFRFGISCGSASAFSRRLCEKKEVLKYLSEIKIENI